MEIKAAILVDSFLVLAMAEILLGFMILSKWFYDGVPLPIDLCFLKLFRILLYIVFISSIFLRFDLFL